LLHDDSATAPGKRGADTDGQMVTQLNGRAEEDKWPAIGGKVLCGTGGDYLIHK
jgi:hypothetical protein